jgi:hypothetical protein
MSKPTTAQPSRFIRMPKRGERVRGFSREKLYGISKKYNGLIRRVEGVSILDTQRLDSIIEAAPDLRESTTD